MNRLRPCRSASRIPARGPVRRGIAFAEIMVAFVLVGTAAVSIAPLIHESIRVRKSLDIQRFAQTEAANLLEQLAGMPYEQVTPDTAGKLTLPDAAGRELPQPKLIAEVVNQTTEPAGKRISIEIQWQPGGGRKSPPCRLVTWIYPRSEDR